MTAEVLVMNRLGVAMAADSAVTVMGGGEGAAGAKIWLSANKVFALSKYEPVGVMVYGAASFLGVPWETVIKLFRGEMGARAFGRVADYSAGLRAFLTTFPGRLGASAGSLCVRHLVRPLLASTAEAIREQAPARVGRGRLTDRARKRIAADIVKERLATAEAADQIVDSPDQAAQAFTRANRGPVQNEINQCFAGVPVFAYTRRDLLRLVSLVLTRDFVLPGAPGVVVAGFGRDEVYPSYDSFRMAATASGRPRCRDEDAGAIVDDDPALVRAFAQGETVQLFMDGIDGGLRDALLGQIRRFFGKMPRAVMARRGDVPEKLARELGDMFESLGDSLVDDLRGVLKRESRSRHWGPIMRTMADQPKDELAVMAETLVTLTSFRKRVSLDEETVGGPVDVLLITKGDGLIWIKRKHYFDPALNHQFFANYFRTQEDARDGPACV